MPKTSGSQSKVAAARGREAEQLARQLVASIEQLAVLRLAKKAEGVEAGIGGLLNGLVLVLAGGAAQLPVGGGLRCLPPCHHGLEPLAPGGRHIGEQPAYPTANAAVVKQQHGQPGQ